MRKDDWRHNTSSSTDMFVNVWTEPTLALENGNDLHWTVSDCRHCVCHSRQVLRFICIYFEKFERLSGPLDEVVLFLYSVIVARMKTLWIWRCSPWRHSTDTLPRALAVSFAKSNNVCELSLTVFLKYTVYITQHLNPDLDSQPLWLFFPYSKNNFNSNKWEH